MPSPFPGMDPYLEGSLWTTFHFAFGAELVRQLAPQLRPRYLALPVERLVFDETNDVAITTSSFYPDVSILNVQPPIDQISVERHTAPLQLATVIPETVPHVSIEIRDTANHQLVTAIEILSPTNKRGDGRLEYLTKRRRILTSTTHLLEIDFLRQGQRVPMQQPLPDAHYFVFLSRADRRPILDVWPILIHEPLPTVPIPLLKDDPDVPIDLQKTFTATYDLLGYDLLINYAQSADIPGDTPTQEWMDRTLQSQGLRDTH
ncbi:MAG: DUF4058 family protein [Chloroflexi bacterium AL-W]|nr:DUF4058 family protein [Chloroflexi bacterium AL-N1]NOK65363.1 DUF4058 family protein [Chloroflexi bacterium AL-N10]NOK72371.1 DUF4058 family protein [Chloroflexi bacterium AL-N5]NOK79542.1 DUF4058 family protein [Chloroflexi bacterium AL-W]NOK87458.1 DUF4058 family protein [Chloroflexi bacterium AL-N15]